MENRKHTRLSVEKDSIAKIRGCPFRVGTITDISISGLSFTYQSESVPANGFRHVDIQLEKDGFELTNLPCSIVYDSVENEKDPNQNGLCRCGLRFRDLNDEHKNKLNYFLSNFTNGDIDEKTMVSVAKEKISDIYRYFIPIIADFLLLMLALAGAQLLKRGGFDFTPIYFWLYGLFIAAWGVISLGAGKYRRIFKGSFFNAIKVILKFNVLLVYIISFATVLWPELSKVSRMQTFGVCGLYFGLELICYVFFTLLRRPDIFRKRGHVFSKARKLTAGNVYPLVITDAALVFIAFAAMNWFKRSSLEFPPRYDYALLLLYALWGLGSFYTRKFNRLIFDASFPQAFMHCVRSAVIMGAGLGVIIFAFRLFYYSRLQLFGVPIVLLGFEFSLFYMYWLYRRQGRIGDDIESPSEVQTIQETSRDLPEEYPTCSPGDPVDIKLKHALEFLDPRLYSFISETIDLKAIDRCETALMSTEEISAFESLGSNELKLVLNLHKTNDVRWFNRYFLQIYRGLKNQGYFIGKVHTFQTHRAYFRSKYSRFLGDIAYMIDCIWCRVFPKLPVFKRLYFTLTKGRNRIVSKAEIFGRLYFCGFKVVADLEAGHRLYFIAQKVKMPAYQTNPTYGPLVQLKRYGYDGRMIIVYKFRTMFPYSEFLQEYIYNNNQLDEGGKFKNDFRVTGWGKVMRAMWLDELPMIYNWLRGEMKLFGVRPLSKQYLSLYTDELRDLRKKVIPGLIPPFYADLPKTLPEIIESEVRYIKSYLKSPVRTQVRYFWRSFDNILIKGARSK